MITSPLAREEFFKRLGENALRIIKKQILRSRLNLSSYERLVDNEDLVARGVQKDILKLYEEGYILLRDTKLFLNCSRIRRKFNLKKALDEVEFFPLRTKGELERLIEENTTQPLQISRSTKYAISSPLGTENIGPLFVLANLWDYKYPGCSFTMAGSNNSLSRYLFLRFLSQMALVGNPRMDELFIWPRLIFLEGLEEWKIESIVKNPYEGDMLRYALITSFSIKQQKVRIDKSRLKGGRNFVYLIANLRKPLSLLFFSNHKERESTLYANYHENMRKLKFRKAISLLEQELVNLSKEINVLKSRKKWNESSRKILGERYKNMLDLVEVFVPAIVNYVKNSQSQMFTFKSHCKGIFFDIAIPEETNSEMIILLPGLPEYPLPKELMFKLAARGYHVVAPRYRGTFESKGNFLAKSPAYDILNLIKFLKKQKKILELYNKQSLKVNFNKLIVLGSSFGGSVALHLAGLTKDVDKYIIIAPVIDFKNHGKKYKEQDLKNLGRFLKEAFPFLYRFEDKNYRRLLEGKIIPSALKGFNTLSEVILIHGKKDDVVSIDNSRFFANKYKNIRLIELEDKGHFSIRKLDFDILLKLLSG